MDDEKVNCPGCGHTILKGVACPICGREAKAETKAASKDKEKKA